ncbi:MAG: EAL domain-containing protein [Spongiibacteraceae bacterium]
MAAIPDRAKPAAFPLRCLLMPLKPEHELGLYLAAASALLAVGLALGGMQGFVITERIALPLTLSCLLLILALGFSFLRRARALQLENLVRQQVEQELEKLSLAVEQSPAAVIITDPRGTIEYVNPKFCRSSGYPLEVLVGRRVAGLFAGSMTQQAFEAMIESVARGEIWHGELPFARSDQQQFQTAATISTLTDKGGTNTHVLMLLEDISDRVAYRENLFREANFDSLTKLPNRQLAMDRLAQAISTAERHRHQLALLFVDLDRFKIVNDTLGHQFGDELLLEAARRLRQCVREEDTVARIGGDEFLIILNNHQSSLDASAAANSVIAAIDQPFLIDARELSITASIGLTIFPDDGNTPLELLRNADAAMHIAKQQGHNTYHFFTPEMNQRALNRLNLETHLRQALKRQEFELFYQPLIALDSGAVIGAEALMRWRKPELGNPGPDVFIPIAEETGLIVPIGQWLLHQACQQAASWLAKGINLRMAVNISSRQFIGNSVVNAVEKALVHNHLPAEHLELEITEGLLLADAMQTRHALAKLHRLGVRLSLDDFGTGYSSLSYLRRYAFDVLKIDRSFIHDVVEQPESAALVRAIVAMAQSLDLEVIAEGVETVAQADFIRSHGCNFAQGYFYSKPMPAAQFEAWLLQYNERVSGNRSH